MKILDTPVHFWDSGLLRQPWIARGSSFDGTALQDYCGAARGSPVDSLVFV
ncbi:MAG TPA: hypothetical protein VFB37_09395 [Steroidobacteraceae bacterium]|nr:hypothetical protein [Steroidobacteraceae bacterium]